LCEFSGKSASRCIYAIVAQVARRDAAFVAAIPKRSGSIEIGGCFLPILPERILDNTLLHRAGELAHADARYIEKWDSVAAHRGIPSRNGARFRRRRGMITPPFRK
jgi:hypothetical protein